MTLIRRRKARKSTRIFAEGALSLEDAEGVLYLMRPSTVEGSKGSIPAAAKAESTFAAERALNQEGLKRLQKLLLVILEKPQLL